MRIIAGYTLIEMLIVLAVFLVVVTLTGNLLLQLIDSWQLLWDIIRLERELNTSLELIIKNLKSAVKINNKITKVSFMDRNGELKEIYQSGNKLYLDSKKNIISNYIKEFKLIEQAEDTFQVKLTAQIRNEERVVESSFKLDMCQRVKIIE